MYVCLCIYNPRCVCVYIHVYTIYICTYYIHIYNLTTQQQKTNNPIKKMYKGPEHLKVKHSVAMTHKFHF